MSIKYLGVKTGYNFSIKYHLAKKLSKTFGAFFRLILNNAIAMVKNWLNENSLELAAHKTEAVLISRKRTGETAEFRVRKLKVMSQMSIKYIGIQIDDRLSFKLHVANVAKKASRTSGALSRLMPNVGNQRQYGG